jgi:hypothetical protein
MKVSGEILGSEKRPTKVLVLLSDMIEDSDMGNFERLQLDDSLTRREIERQRKAGLLPDLRGVRVYVVGANAVPMDRAAAIERFWRSYFSTCGATLGPGAYSRALPSFEE